MGVYTPDGVEGRMIPAPKVNVTAAYPAAAASSNFQVWSAFVLRFLVFKHYDNVYGLTHDATSPFNISLNQYLWSSLVIRLVGYVVS